jgi:hypothetical protein
VHARHTASADQTQRCITQPILEQLARNRPVDETSITPLQPKRENWADLVVIATIPKSSPVIRSPAVDVPILDNTCAGPATIGKGSASCEWAI